MMNMQETDGEVRSRDGTSIGFSKVGSGPPLVMVHGSLATGRDWLPVANGLSESRTSYVLDRRGRGGSGEFGEYSLSKEAQDINAVVQAAGPDACLLGHSYGAICALEAACRHDVAKLIIYEPPLPIHGPVVGSAFADFRSAVEREDLDEALKIGLRNLIRMPEQAIEGFRSSPLWSGTAALTPTWIPECEEMSRLEPGVARFADMAAPTLLLLGTETPAHHVHATRALESILPTARIAELTGQGHMAHLTATDQVVAAIEKFLRE